MAAGILWAVVAVIFGLGAIGTVLALVGLSRGLVDTDDSPTG